MERPSENPNPVPDRRPAHDLAAGLGLLLIVLAAHGVSLWDGLFFDDHWHRAAIRNYGWSPQDLVDAATVDLSGKLNHLWWQTDPMVWRYARPVAMLLMKLEYVLSSGDPMILHACALGWHWLTTLLVYALARQARLARRWAFVAGLMFVIMPHSFFSIGWTAARNALVGGFLFAAAVLAYMSASLGKPSTNGFVYALRNALPVLFWILAILSRETAIVFAAVILLTDLTLGGWRHLISRLPHHALLWILTLAFVAWRWTSFQVQDIPAIYLVKPKGPTDVAYLIWAASKFLQMLFSQIIYTPMLMGLASYKGLPREQWVVHGIMAGIVALIAIWYVATSRNIRGRWLWPAWLIAAFAPVIPIFAMPHFSYLPSVPYAVITAILMAGVTARWRALVATLVIGATVWSLFVYRVAWWGIIRSEQVIYVDMSETTPAPPPPGAKLFFINLPIVAIYAPDAMREVWNNPDLTGYTLTFAPHPLVMNGPSVVEQLNDRELRVSTSAPGYFSGLPGQMLVDGMRAGAPLTAAMHVRPGPDYPFEVTVEEADSRGVRALKFTFAERLDSPNYYFYLSSPERAGYRLQFGPVKSAPGQDEGLFADARSTDLPTRIRALTNIRDLARPVAIATGSPIQSDLGMQSEQSLARVEQWWKANDVRRRSEEITRWRRIHARILRQRSLYFEVMSIVERSVRSDLYLTGSQ